MIPSNANVYYAINTQHDLNFILKEKVGKDDLLPEPGETPRGTRKPSRDTSKARKKLLGLTL